MFSPKKLPIKRQNILGRFNRPNPSQPVKRDNRGRDTARTEPIKLPTSKENFSFTFKTDEVPWPHHGKKLLSVIFSLKKDCTLTEQEFFDSVIKWDNERFIKSGHHLKTETIVSGFSSAVKYLKMLKYSEENIGNDQKRFYFLKQFLVVESIYFSRIRLNCYGAISRIGAIIRRLLI